MADGSISTGGQLLDGILQGRVPRQVRIFAAQGLLPVSREDLLRLQVVLSADPDEELAATAAASVAEVPEEQLVSWLRSEQVEAIVLDLLIRIRDEESVWLAVARSTRVSDETLRVLARNGNRVVQDVIITNQIRVMECLEILEELRANPQIDQVVLRRVREFEEEFIEKALAQELEEAREEQDASVRSIREALDALRALGARIPGEGSMPVPTGDDPALAEAVEKMGLSTFGRLLTMGIKEKIQAGLKGGREERTILINSRNRLVVRAVLSSPRLTDPEIEGFASLRSVSDEVIRAIASHPRWTRRYPVVLALVQNPKTPPQAAMRFLPRLSTRDVLRVSRDRNVNPLVRRQALNVLERKK